MAQSVQLRSKGLRNARRKSVNIVRSIGVDTRYGSELVQKLINIVMWRGKKTVATTIVYDALDLWLKKLAIKTRCLRPW